MPEKKMFCELRALIQCCHIILRCEDRQRFRCLCFDDTLYCNVERCRFGVRIYGLMSVEASAVCVDRHRWSMLSRTDSFSRPAKSVADIRSAVSMVVLVVMPERLLGGVKDCLSLV